MYVQGTTEQENPAQDGEGLGYTDGDGEGLGCNDALTWCPYIVTG